VYKNLPDSTVTLESANKESWNKWPNEHVHSMVLKVGNGEEYLEDKP